MHKHISLTKAIDVFYDELPDMLNEKLPVLKDKLTKINKEIRQQKDQEREHFNTVLDKHNIPMRDRELYKLIQQLFGLRSDKLIKEKKLVKEELSRIKRLKNIYTLKRQGKDDEILDVESAKQVPIQNIFSGTLKKKGKYLIAYCPFHSENNPSFTVYPKTNSFYCFSCGEGGDVIDLTMMLNDFSFVEAVQYLV